MGKTGTGATLPAKYVYDDQLRIVAELDAGTGAITHVYAYGEKSNVPELVYQPVTAKTYRIVSDVRGSVRLVLELPTTAGATPVVRQRIDYDAWGLAIGLGLPGATESVNLTGDANFKRVSLGYAGGLWDRDTGFVRFGARDYDPNTGRWTAKDPIRFTGGVNLYAYVAGDPVSRTDPAGLKPNQPGWDICDVPIIGLLCNFPWPPTPGTPGDGLDFGPLPGAPGGAGGPGGGGGSGQPPNQCPANNNGQTKDQYCSALAEEAYQTCKRILGDSAYCLDSMQRIHTRCLNSSYP